MKVAVCVKQIPDPNQPYALDDGRLRREGSLVLDPGDEFGVEAALQITEQHGGEVTVVSMGPAKAVETVRRALSMGAHKGVLVTDDGLLPGADALVTARVLSAAIRRGEPDLVIACVESTDGSTGTVPGTVAEILGFPQATVAKHIEVKNGSILIHRQTEKGYDVVECALPAVVTVTAGVNTPRYPSFKGIMQAKNKPLEQMTVADLGLNEDDVRVTQEVASVNPAPERGAGEVVQDGGEGAARIADFLKELKVL